MIIATSSREHRRVEQREERDLRVRRGDHDADVHVLAS
jgi:hypothetical protein